MTMSTSRVMSGAGTGQEPQGGHTIAGCQRGRFEQQDTHHQERDRRGDGCEPLQHVNTGRFNRISARIGEFPHRGIHEPWREGPGRATHNCKPSHDFCTSIVVG